MGFYTGKVAAITGAGSGIGRALAVDLAARGCDLALSDVDGAGLQATLSSAKALGVRVTATVVDVADRAAVYAWADQVVAELGKVNLIFNNAGVGVGCTVEGADYADFEWLMGIDFWGVVYGTKAFLPHLRASGDGHVVNISSVFGLVAVPGNCSYNAAKFAVRGFSECLAQELALSRAPVAVSCVHPGGIQTNIVRASRMRPDLLALLGSDEQSSKSAFEDRFITTAPQAATQILAGVERKKRRILVGGDAWLLDKLVRLFPQFYQTVMVWATRRHMAGQVAQLGKASS